MKKSLIILHGALGSSTQFLQLSKHLSSEFDVHTFNFEGHGGEPIPHLFSIHRFAEQVRDYILDNHLEKCSIFGYSMGGYVALELALQHPTLVHKVVTLGTKFDWNPLSAAKELKMLDPVRIENKVPLFAQQLQLLHGENWKDVVLKTADMMLALGNGEALTSGDFANITQPVMAVIGKDDNMVTIQETEFAVNAMPNATMNVIDCQHPIDKVPADVLAVICRGFF